MAVVIVLLVPRLAGDIDDPRPAADGCVLLLDELAPGFPTGADEVLIVPDESDASELEEVRSDGSRSDDVRPLVKQPLDEGHVLGDAVFDRLMLLDSAVDEAPVFPEAFLEGLLEVLVRESPVPDLQVFGFGPPEVISVPQEDIGVFIPFVPDLVVCVVTGAVIHIETLGFQGYDAPGLRDDDIPVLGLFEPFEEGRDILVVSLVIQMDAEFLVHEDDPLTERQRLFGRCRVTFVDEVEVDGPAGVDIKDGDDFHEGRYLFIDDGQVLVHLLELCFQFGFLRLDEDIGH